VLWDKGAGNSAFDTAQQSAAKEIGATYTKPKRRAPQPWEVIKDARSNKAYPAKQYMPKFLKN
jgi:hypothetical protein